MQKRRPYIGISGIARRSEVDLLSLHVPLNPDREFAVGILVSSKTIEGLSVRHPQRYPNSFHIADLFYSGFERAIGLIHYATQNCSHLEGELFAVRTLGGEFCTGLQLNVPWPTIDAVEDYYCIYPRDRLILQIGKEAMAMAGHSPARVAELTKDYVPCVSDVLIDWGGGKEGVIDVEKTLEYFRAIRDTGYDIGLGFAGGLTRANLSEKADPIWREFPHASTNVERGVRYPQDDSLNIGEAVRYLKDSFGRVQLVQCEK